MLSHPADRVAKQERPAAPDGAAAEAVARTGRAYRAALRRARAGRTVAIAIALVFGALATHALLDLMEGTPLRVVTDAAVPPPIADAAFAQAASALLQTSLEPGNRFELLADGGTFGRLWSDLEGARSTITIQLYYCQAGAAARRLEAVLSERARHGVRVLFLPDGFGCRNLPRGSWDRLRRAGVRVEVFRPVRWYSLHRAQHRSHVRAVVVDGTIGYTGGFGIDDKWLPRGRHDEWRETNVRITGPAVAQLQGAFAAGWAEATGELLAGPDFFPAAVGDTAGRQRGGVAYSVPAIGATIAERLLALSIASADRTLFISNSYFVPDADFRALLREASGRGVDVRVLTAGRDTDVPVTRLAGRAHYQELLDAGVRIYEYGPVMMHAKSFVADGAWASIGTLNFDNRSLRLNEESTALVLDTGFGRTMDSLFVADLGRAAEILSADFSSRPWWDRLLEACAYSLWLVL